MEKLNEVKKSSDLRKIGDAELMCYHLFKYPVFEALKPKDDTINVMVLGCGYYGQQILDQVIPLLQIPDKFLNITIVAVNVEDMEKYCNNRPDLKRFFVINGNEQNIDEKYGEINFVQFEFDKEKCICKEELENVSCELLSKNSLEKDPDLIFVALGNDDLSYGVARNCSGLYNGANVYYIQEFETKDFEGHLCPINFKIDVKNDSKYREMERYAFNLHLLWEAVWTGDFSKIEERFYEKYNYLSNLAGVNNIFAKLCYLGIDVKDSIEKSAIEYSEKLGDADKINELIYMEHRRWVAEKICAGWTKRKVKDVDNFDSKDKNDKKHICLVPSRKDQKLSDLGLTKWKESSLMNLDPLDQVSVNLHLHYEVHSKKIGDLMGYFRRAMSDFSLSTPRANFAFDTLISNVAAIINKDRTKVSQYEKHKSAFLDSFESERQKEAIKSALEDFEKKFNWVLYSLEYKNYKDEDIKIVENVPFILTYNPNAAMLMEFKCDEQCLVDNIAVPSVINPQKIFYVSKIKKDEDFEKIKNSLANVQNFKKFKGLRSDLSLFIVSDKTNLDEQKSSLKVECGDVEVNYGTYDDCKKQLAEIIKITEMVLVDGKSDLLGKVLEENEFKNSVLRYKFNSKKLIFEDGELLNFIPAKNNFTVNDMLALRSNVLSRDSLPPKFELYKNMYDVCLYGPSYDETKKYIGTPGKQVWFTLCRKLKEYFMKVDSIGQFSKASKNSTREYSFSALMSCQDSISEIINKLVEYKFIANNSSITVKNSELCQVKIYDISGNDENEYKKLFSKVECLTDPNLINIWFDSKRLHIDCCNLKVENFMYNEASDVKHCQIEELLGWMEKAGYIVFLEKNIFGAFSFRFLSKSYRDLFTQEGRVLEIFLYHKLLDSQLFDDVVLGKHICIDSSDSDNELDIIVTKGFSSAFVEVKACTKLEEKYYDKLNNLTQKFGAGSYSVLVQDTSAYGIYKDENDRIKADGEKLGVITLNDSDEVRNNFPQKLSKILTDGC